MLTSKRMKQACDLASKSVSQYGTGPFGCVITDRLGNVIGEGHNRVTLDKDPTQHAEIVAIRNACKKAGIFDLSGCILYTSCEPCPMCLSAIYWARIDKVFYGNTRKDAKEIGFDDDFIYEEVNKRIEERTIPMEKWVDMEYAKTSFQMWNMKEDKIQY
jgi:guanine deaminase